MKIFPKPDQHGVLVCGDNINWLKDVESRRKEKASVFEVAAPTVKREVIELSSHQKKNDAQGDASVMQAESAAEGGSLQ